MRLFSITFIFMFAFSMLYNTYPVQANFENGKEKLEMMEGHKHHHRLIEPEKVKELNEKGFTKQEIFMGAILSKKSGKNIDDVLNLYKNKNSWDAVAEELGIDMDEFKRIEAMHHWEKIIKNHQEEVIEYLAEYSDTKEKNIRKLLDDNTSLRFLVGASVMAKLSDKDLEDIVKMKKQGKSFHEILEELDIGEENLHKELNDFKMTMKSKLKEKLEEEEDATKQE